MDKSDIKSRLTTIFRDTLGNESLVIEEATTAQDVEEWDSLAHINLIVAVEKGFGISMTTREVKSLKNVGDLIELVHKKAV